MADDALHEGGSDGGRDRLRARVNGRRYEFDRYTGEVLKGPGGVVGKYVAANQLERIAKSSGYYGHLFLADREDTRRLKEAEFALMEHRASQGRITLVKDMSINFNGHAARVVDLTEASVTLEMGNVERKFSRERVENEATADYTAPPKVSFAPEDMWENEPELHTLGDEPKQQKYEGSVEIDMDDLAEKVAEKMQDGDFMEALADRIAQRLGNTLSNDGA
jgi:hypothetical protein